MNRPWLSVVVPTYNGAAYLDDALRSIAAQADDGVEIIAVDDGSTDATVAILERHASRLPMRIERRGRVGNWVANSNHGLRLARAEHVCFLHQDDRWLPGRLRALRPLLNRNRSAMLLHPSRYISSCGRFLGMWHCPLTAGVHAPAQVVERLLVQNFIAVPAPIFPRRAALEIGGLDESLWYTADWDFWLKLAALGTTIYHALPWTAFRVHGGSQTMQGTARSAEMRRQLDVVLDRHLPRLRRGRDVPQIHAAAHLSVELNHALADAAGGRRPSLWPLARAFLSLGISGCHRFLRDSRIVERVRARVRSRW